jgi:Domain of unknown function (DUF6265)
MSSALALLLLLAAPAQPLPKITVSDLGWLAGCWASRDGEPGSQEQWMAPAGGTLLGMSRTVKNGRTVAWEFLQIRESEGGLAFVAKPSGQEEATFPLLRAGERELVFENPAHDFPQRVLYRLDEKGGLRARIEGVRNGSPLGIDFPMDRVDCGKPLTRP